MESEAISRGSAAARRDLGRVPIDLLLVAVGGAAGTLARYALTAGVPQSQSFAVFVINVSGALLLGMIVALLAGRHVRLQLLLGTGVCGGFTTYSAFALGIEQLAAAQPWAAIWFALGTVVAGIAAAGGGVWIGSALRRTLERRRRYVLGDAS